MNKWIFSMMVITLMVIMTWAPFSFGAVSPEEAAQLGTTLTGVGAEKAGNKDGAIPPYTGGLTKSPANYQPGSGVYTDPFPSERPLLSINAQNMAQYADKLTEGTKALMKKFSSFHIDVYKTHRTVAFPEFVIKNTAKNAVKAMTYSGGLSIKEARAGYPFPIPKDGFEAMWNHLLRYSGRAWADKYSVWNVDMNGKARMAQDTILQSECAYYDEDLTRYDADTYWKARWVFLGPPRLIGEAGMLIDPLNMYEKGRVAYQYLPGQRRVKLAPEIGFDTPVSYQMGAITYDDQRMFCGSMERFNMKLIGKKHMYVPYNSYNVTFTPPDKLFGPKHINPDVVRWELHRVWVVEGALKPGKRHIYRKRRFYLDEDQGKFILHRK
jgi:hypothetical protein